MRRALLAVALILGCRELPGEAEAARPDVTAPCEGCHLELPAGSGSVPLLVVLHGDSEHAKKWFDRWRGPALEHGYGILALECPEKLGCPDGSWYKWNGDPKWITDQVDAVAARTDIDKARSILVGWSGGATFLGMHLERWPGHFAALVVHGGGVPPPARKCAPRALPTYFLVGDKNWFHASTRELRTFVQSCGSELVWDVAEGADHKDEDHRLDPLRANMILEWIGAHIRPRVAG